MKGRTPGINNDTHDIKLEIEAGNYKPDELVTTLNESIQTMNQIIDTDISSSAFSYNPYTSLCKFSGNLKKQYTESSYYIDFRLGKVLIKKKQIEIKPYLLILVFKPKRII